MDSGNGLTSYLPWQTTLLHALQQLLLHLYRRIFVQDAIYAKTVFPFLGIDPEKTVIWKDKCTKMFIAAHIISKTWKKPKCLLTDKIDKYVVCVHTHTHTGIYSDHKREQYNTICSNMNGPRMIILSEVR